MWLSSVIGCGVGRKLSKHARERTCREGRAGLHGYVTVTGHARRTKRVTASSSHTKSPSYKIPFQLSNIAFVIISIQPHTNTTRNKTSHPTHPACAIRMQHASPSMAQSMATSTTSGNRPVFSRASCPTDSRAANSIACSSASPVCCSSSQLSSLSAYFLSAFTRSTAWSTRSRPAAA